MAREEVLDHSAVMTPERGYSAPMPVLLELELGFRGHLVLTNTHHKSPLRWQHKSDTQPSRSKGAGIRHTHANKARNDMPPMPVLVVATPMVETMTRTSSMPYNLVRPYLSAK